MEWWVKKKALSSTYTATIEVPIEKRKKLIGVGGHRIRAILSDTGAYLDTISDERMSIFAPTKEVMENVMERVEEVMAEEPEVGY